MISNSKRVRQTKPVADVDAQVGNRIRDLRRARRVTLEHVGKAIGVTYQQVQKYESGTNRIPASQLWRISTHLGVSVEMLFPSCDPDGVDTVTIARLNRLPVRIRTLVADLAEAIANAERNAVTQTRSEPA